MTHPHEPVPSVDRRYLLRGGALAAGAATVGALLHPEAAEAANGDPLILGAENTASTTTALSSDTAAPALKISNPSGPTLSLEPVSDSWAGELAVGEIANSTAGPLVGVDYGDGVETLFLTTTRQIDELPTTYPVSPSRIVDTRWTNVPITIIATSKNALDSKHRLRAGAHMDVAIAPAGEGLEYGAAFLTVTAVRPDETGYLVAYPPGNRPITTSVSYQADQTISNAAFTSLEIIEDFYAVRIYSTATTHVLVDVTGVIVTADQSVSAEAASMRAATKQRRRKHSAVEQKINRAIGSHRSR